MPRASPNTWSRARSCLEGAHALRQGLSGNEINTKMRLRQARAEPSSRLESRLCVFTTMRLYLEDVPSLGFSGGCGYTKKLRARRPPHGAKRALLTLRSSITTVSALRVIRSDAHMKRRPALIEGTNTVVVSAGPGGGGNSNGNTATTWPLTYFGGIIQAGIGNGSESAGNVVAVTVDPSLTIQIGTTFSINFVTHHVTLSDRGRRDLQCRRHRAALCRWLGVGQPADIFPGGWTTQSTLSPSPSHQTASRHLAAPSPTRRRRVGLSPADGPSHAPRQLRRSLGLRPDGRWSHLVAAYGLGDLSMGPLPEPT
jgi:hypothetical protein